MAIGPGTAGGNQPMWDAERRCVLVFNGQIYNHAELRRDLEAAGRPFLSDHSDTEVILQAYLAWGIEGMHRRFNGMWAIALYDLEKKRLLLSRDRFGEKPLYYTDQHNVFAFASGFVCAFAVASAFRLIFRIETEVNERVVTFA